MGCQGGRKVGKLVRKLEAVVTTHRDTGRRGEARGQNFPDKELTRTSRRAGGHGGEATWLADRWRSLIPAGSDLATLLASNQPQGLGREGLDPTRVLSISRAKPPGRPGQASVP